MFIVSSIERSSLKESKRAARRRIEEQERNRGVQERVQGETEKGRASKRNKAAAIFVRERLAHQVGGKRAEQSEDRERERERENLAALTREGEEYGRKVGSGR